MLFLPLHAPILKPNFDLSFRQTERMCNFYPSFPGKVAVEMEFFLEFKSLIPCVGLPASFPLWPWKYVVEDSIRNN